MLCDQESTTFLDTQKRLQLTFHGKHALSRASRQVRWLQPCQVNTALQLRTTPLFEDHWSQVAVRIDVTSLLQVVSLVPNLECS